jgi:hypothetical protein
MKIKDKMLLILLAILFLPISMPLLIVDYFSDRKKRFRVLKRNGFSHNFILASRNNHLVV